MTEMKYDKTLVRLPLDGGIWGSLFSASSLYFLCFAVFLQWACMTFKEEKQ